MQTLTWEFIADGVFSGNPYVIGWGFFLLIVFLLHVVYSATK